jgi:hypothetical protein
MNTLYMYNVEVFTLHQVMHVVNTAPDGGVGQNR